MDFGKFPSLRDPAAFVGADVIIWQPESGKILTGVRQNKPWKGYLTLMFGGYVDPSDQDPMRCALREAAEETGLVVKATGFVGMYGPERFRHRLRQIVATRTFVAEATPEPAHIRPAVSIVFVGIVVGGILKDTAEQKSVKWLRIEDVVNREFVAFDHARALCDWLNHGQACSRALDFLSR